MRILARRAAIITGAGGGISGVRSVTPPPTSYGADRSAPVEILPGSLEAD
jgi:hypothetical protein